MVGISNESSSGKVGVFDSEGKKLESSFSSEKVPVIGIVVSGWYYDEITGPMLTAAKEGVVESGAEVGRVIVVPGSFDIPYGVKKLCDLSGDDAVDGVVTLGAVVSGSTDHDQVICYSLTKLLMELGCAFGKPVVLGVNGPKMTKEQAIARIPRAKEVAVACVEMCREI